MRTTIYLPSAVGLHRVGTRKGLSKVKVLPFLQHLIPPPTEDLLKNSKNWIDKRSAPESKVLTTKSRSRKALAGTGMCKQPPVEPELEPRTQRSIWNPELDQNWIRCASTREHQERSLSCAVVTNKKKRDDSHKMMH
jgi:hypothetical protein